MSNAATEAYQNFLRELSKELQEYGEKILQASDRARSASDDEGEDDG